MKVCYNKSHTSEKSNMICLLIALPKLYKTIPSPLYMNLKYSYIKLLLRCKYDIAIVNHFWRGFIVTSATSENMNINKNEVVISTIFNVLSVLLCGLGNSLLGCNLVFSWCWNIQMQTGPKKFFYSSLKPTNSEFQKQV